MQQKMFDKNYLDVHLRIRTNAKLFVCEQCSRKFSYKYCFLNMHLYTDTNEKRYGCIFQQKFFQKGNLNTLLHVRKIVCKL